MNPPPAGTAPPPKPLDGSSWNLTLLLDAQSVDWQRGVRSPVESYLKQRPVVADDPDVVISLIYHEVLLRRRLDGETPVLEEYIERFPHLAEPLAIHFALDQALTLDGSDVPALPEPSPASPIHIPGYEVLELLGRGGMGVVYRARQAALNRTVALKMILEGVHSGARQAHRFRTEAEVIARLQHPNIVQIFEIGEHEGRPYLVLEFVEGGTLDRALAGIRLPAERAARLVRTLATAVEHAHERGVIHRDLKPANVLLDAGGEPKITDFGLAKLLAGDSRQTESGALVGTPSYMAPEQLEAVPAKVGPLTDVYALGAILYELLTGRPPFRAESPIVTMLQVKGSEVVPPRRLRPDLPRDLETICLKCLDREARRRYSSAAAVAEDLDRFLDGRPIVARPVPAVERLWLWSRRQKALAGGLLAAVLATVALLAGGVYHSYELTRLNSELTSSNRALEAARAGAEQNAADALAAITQMLVRVADRRLADIPEAEPVRRELLAEALLKLDLLRARAPTDPEIRHEMGRAHLGIAALHKSLGEYSRAVDQCRSALAILDPLLETHPNDALADTSAQAHLALAEHLTPEEGRAHFVRAVALLRPLAERDPAVRGRLADAYYSIAFTKEGFGLEPAESYCRQAISLLESLAREAPSVYSRHLARATHNLGLVRGHGRPPRGERGTLPALPGDLEFDAGGRPQRGRSRRDHGVPECPRPGAPVAPRGQSSERGGSHATSGRRVQPRAGASPSSPPDLPVPGVAIPEQPRLLPVEREAVRRSRVDVRRGGPGQ